MTGKPLTTTENTKNMYKISEERRIQYGLPENKYLVQPYELQENDLIQVAVTSPRHTEVFDEAISEKVMLVDKIQRSRIFVRQQSSFGEEFYNTSRPLEQEAHLNTSLWDTQIYLKGSVRTNRLTRFLATNFWTRPYVDLCTSKIRCRICGEKCDEGVTCSESCSASRKLEHQTIDQEDIYA